MKNYKYIIFPLILSIVFSLSCSNDILDEIDTDPNNPTDVPINYILPNAQINMVHDFLGGTPAHAISTYVELSCNVHLNPLWPDRMTGNWNEAYSILMDTKTIIEKGSEENEWLHVGIAQIVQAITLGTLTDLFGDVPFTEALQGSDIRNPNYDSQEVIYTILFTMLDNAIINLSKEAISNPGNNDLLLQGDKNMWVKVAWGLKARYYNRLSNIDPNGSATDALEAILNSFESPDEGLIFSDYTSGSTYSNPFSYHEQIEKTFAASLTIFDVIDSFNDAGFNDPRAERWFNKIDGEFVGAPNGENIPDLTHTTYSGISTSSVLNLEAPLAVLTYDELKFIEAEANFRLENFPEANLAYQEAVKAACSRTGLTTDEITAYISQGNVFTDDGNLTLDMIIKQKFLSFFMMQPIEAFNDYRRTGIPSLYNTAEGIVKRLPYPNTELSTNSNAPDDINNVTIYTKKVWWAKE